MTAPAVPPAPAPAPAPAAPQPKPTPPPTPPAVNKPQVKKLDFERETDAFNVVTDSSMLTHQNVMRLMREAFLKRGNSEEEVEAMSMETCAITGDSVDENTDLLTAILKFIGGGKTLASIALCSGGHRDSTTGEISGGTHWTALNLRYVGNGNGSWRVEAIHMDSAGVPIPEAVTKVLGAINSSSIPDLRAKLSLDLQSNQIFQTALERLQKGGNDQGTTTVVPYYEDCDQQQDGNSCGYHAVFNLARMHQGNWQQVGPTLEQDGKQVGSAEFITARRRDLKAIFAGPVLHEGAVASADPASAAADQAAITPSDKEAARIYQIIFADDKNGDGRYVVKLKKLMEAEQRLLAGGEENVFLLSELQLEKHYERIICEWVEELKERVQKGADADTDVTNQIQFLNDLKVQEAWQNPKAIFEVLSKVSSEIVRDKDFLQVSKIAELNKWKSKADELEVGEIEEKNWADYFAALKSFFDDQTLPESSGLYNKVREEPSEEVTGQDYKRAVQKIHATIQTEKTKQKVFGELEFFGEKVQDDGNLPGFYEDARELTCSDKTKYGLKTSDEGIKIFQEVTDVAGGGATKMEEVGPEEQNSILSKLEKEIRAREKGYATSHPAKNFVKDGDEIIQATDGSIKFKSTRAVDLSAEDPFKKFAKDDAKNWQETKKLEHGKVEIVKWNKLERDDERWELIGGKVELKPIEFGEEKAGRKAGAKVAITTLDRDLMSYYLHGKSGAAVEAQKRKYGVERTVEKISDLKKPDTLIKLISVRAMKERGSAGVTA